jgi:hypothetical protein
MLVMAKRRKAAINLSNGFRIAILTLFVPLKFTGDGLDEKAPVARSYTGGLLRALVSAHAINGPGKRNGLRIKQEFRANKSL